MKNHIHHDITIKASPKEVYDTLTDGNRFSSLTGGAPAAIDAKEGGSITLFGDYVTGKNVELIENQRVVQTWRAKGWPEGITSEVKFELKSEGDGTRIEFDHIGFPEDQKEHLDQGWHDNYWNPMKEQLGG